MEIKSLTFLDNGVGRMSGNASIGTANQRPAPPQLRAAIIALGR